MTTRLFFPKRIALAVMVAMTQLSTLPSAMAVHIPETLQENTTAVSGADIPVVILKLDDLKPGSNFPRWVKTIDFLVERGIKCSAGISAKDLENTDVDFFSWIKNLNESGMVEFWNHGYTHGKTKIDGVDYAEFQLGYAEQKASIEKAQALATEQLGFTFHVFGAPFNAVDATTAKVLAENPDLTIWFYGTEALANQAGYTGLVLKRKINIENPTITPNFESFKASYERGNLGPYIAVQGHPPYWDDDAWNNFVQIIDYLQEKGSVFMTPSEYAESLKPPQWAGYNIDGDGFVDTGSWLGWVYLSGESLAYIYSYSLGDWLYLPDPGPESGGGWAWISI